MLTIPATVCTAGARTKRRLSFASIPTARGCPGPLQGLGMKEHVLSSIVRCCSTWTMGRQLGTSARGCFPLPLRHEALPGSCSNPNYVSGWFLIPSPPWPPWGAEVLSCHPSPHSAPTSGDICLLRPTGALMTLSLCGCCAGTPFFEICFNHIYTV